MNSLLTDTKHGNDDKRKSVPMRRSDDKGQDRLKYGLFKRNLCCSR